MLQVSQFCWLMTILKKNLDPHKKIPTGTSACRREATDSSKADHTWPLISDQFGLFFSANEGNDHHFWNL